MGMQISSCNKAGVAGVNCLPNSELFATGMNGDEDLAEDITMKGDKFHYMQRPAENQYFATGMNGDEDLAEDITMKGDKFHYIQKSGSGNSTKTAKPFAEGMNGGEDLG